MVAGRASHWTQGSQGRPERPGRASAVRCVGNLARPWPRRRATLARTLKLAARRRTTRPARAPSCCGRGGCRGAARPAHATRVDASTFGAGSALAVSGESKTGE